MRTEIIRDWTGVDRLMEEWKGLLASSRADILFLRPEWIDAWRVVHGGEPDPFVVVARDGRGAIGGIAPFYRTVYRLAGLLKYKVLRILADHPTGSECIDWILREDVEREAAAAIAMELEASRDEWDFIWMPYVPGWTGGSGRLKEAGTERGFLYSERSASFGYLELPREMDSLLAKMSSRQKTAYRSLDRKLFQEGGARFIRCTAEEEIPAFLGALFDLHAKRWALGGELGTFRKKPNEARFYRTFAPVAFRNGWLRIYGIVQGDVFQAVQIGYNYNGVYLSVQEGFNPEAHQGIGNLLRYKVMEELIREGIKGYDFLGEMSEHKRRWRVIERPGSHVMIGNRKAKNLLLFRNGVWPTGRYLKHAESAKFRGEESR